MVKAQVTRHCIRVVKGKLDGILPVIISQNALLMKDIHKYYGFIVFINTIQKSNLCKSSLIFTEPVF
jgi:hypothetical protein